MTRKYLKSEDVENLRESTKKYVEDHNAIKELNSKIEEIKKEAGELEEKMAKLEKPYRGDYGGTDAKNPNDDFGILSFVRGRNDCHEAQILSLDGDQLAVEICVGYYKGDHPRTTVSLSALLEKGYVALNGSDGDIYGFLTNGVEKVEDIVLILSWILKKEKGHKLQELKNSQEWVERSKAEISKLEKELKIYEAVPDDEISRLFNSVSFSVSDMEAENIIAALPRKVVIE